MNRIIKEIEGKGYIRILEAHSGLSAKVVDDSKFDGIWESSLTDSASRGLPDTELVTMDMRLDKIREIINISNKIIIVDGDTGGQVNHFPYWVKQLEREGVDAVIIEDKAFPKVNSLAIKGKHQLEKVSKFCEKIKAGKAVANNIMIIARLESLIAGHSMDEAMRRATRFINAGADGIMIHSKVKVGDEVLEFAGRFKDKYPNVPFVCVPTTYNHIDDDELRDFGFNIIIHANHLLRGSLLAMQRIAYDIYDAGNNKVVNSQVIDVKDLLKLTKSV